MSNLNDLLKMQLMSRRYGKNSKEVKQIKKKITCSVCARKFNSQGKEKETT